MASFLPPPSAQGTPPPQRKSSKTKSFNQPPPITSSSASRTPKSLASRQSAANIDTSTFRAPPPTRHNFDPWNAYSTGHQRAENRLSGSTSWRSSRTRKLTAQFRAGFASGGGEVLYDAVGAGSKDFGRDGRLANGAWDGKTVNGARKKSGVGDDWGDLGEWVVRGEGKNGTFIEGNRRIKRIKLDTNDNDKEEEEAICIVDREKWKQNYESHDLPPLSAQVPTAVTDEEETSNETQRSASMVTQKQKIINNNHLPPAAPFDAPAQTLETTPPSAQPLPSAGSSPNITDKPLHPGTSSSNSFPSIAPLLRLPPSTLFHPLTFHILGSTYPFISDHTLKLLLATHGGRVELGLARRRVSHVIVGYGVSGGAALAAGKVQREVESKGGRKVGVRFVQVAWALECLRLGRRVGEAGFAVEVNDRSGDDGGGLGGAGRAGAVVVGAGAGQRTVRDMFKSMVGAESGTDVEGGGRREGNC